MERVDRSKYKATTDNELYEFYIDYPPTYNEYGKQLIERDVDNALSCIFRSFYGSRTLLPEVPGLFIDIERYTHILDALENRMELNTLVNQVVQKICGEMNPEVNVTYDASTQKLIYDISLKGKFLLKVEHGNTFQEAEITKMNKRFFE